MPEAIMEMTDDLLVELLHLPKGTKILAARKDYFAGDSKVIEFLVDHPSIPEGCSRVVPSFITHYGEPPKTVKFEGWNPNA